MLKKSQSRQTCKHVKMCEQSMFMCHNDNMAMLSTFAPFLPFYISRALEARKIKGKKGAAVTPFISHALVGKKQSSGKDECTRHQSDSD
jgi:hypothetical protein